MNVQVDRNKEKQIGCRPWDFETDLPAVLKIKKTATIRFKKGASLFSHYTRETGYIWPLRGRRHISANRASACALCKSFLAPVPRVWHTPVDSRTWNFFILSSWKSSFLIYFIIKSLDYSVLHAKWDSSNFTPSACVRCDRIRTHFT